MQLDPVALAGLVAREVRTAERDGTTTKVVVARRTYPTDQADLWDAVTNAERIPRWFLPVSGDLTVGGRYQLEGNAGGVVERCDAPDSFAVTWEMGDNVSWLTVTLRTADGGTTLELAHEAEISPFWDEYGPGAVGVGWDLGLLGLGLHVESDGVPVDPAEFATFTFSPEGIEFVRRSTTGWGDAAIGDGDDELAARSAAERTFTFYTVVPDAGPDHQVGDGPA